MFLGKKVTTDDYDHLLSIGRYEKTTLNLLGKDFTVADTHSFYWSYKEIFVDEIYDFKTTNADPVIIDCGSNYGAGVVYLKSIYPKAKITAVEPDPDIFDILSGNVNTRQYDDVTLIQKAISNSKEKVSFYQEGADSGRIHVNTKCKNVIEVDTIQLDDLIDGHVDFLKVDVEGAETEAICSSEKLKNVSNLFIEYHSFKDSEQTLHDILYKLKDNGFKYYIQTQYCAKRPLYKEGSMMGMDLQLNIFAKRKAE